MLRGLCTLFGLILVLVRTKCAPVDTRGARDSCGVLKNRISEVERTVNLYQTNHDSLEAKVSESKQSLDKLKASREFVDTMLESTSEHVLLLDEKYDLLYTDLEIITNITQQVRHSSGEIQDKVKSFSNQASYLQRQIDNVKGALGNLNQKFSEAPKPKRVDAATKDDRRHPILVRKMKQMQRKSENMGRLLNHARGQTWAMRKNVRSLETGQEKLKREIRSLRQMSQDNMAIISNQFLSIQGRMDKTLVQFNATINERLRVMRDDIFNEVMSTAVQHLILKPAKYILEQGWYPQIHHQDSDKD